MTDTSWAETRNLIVAALDRSPGDREQFVRDHCADVALSDSLTALLGTGEAAPEHFIPPASPGDEGPHPALNQVGPYVVEGRLGRGGMGEVFLARDPRLDRLVALKRLLASPAAGPDLRERIVREARAAARITHPHVAAVYDVVEHEGGAFIVMEYVEGENLSALIRRGALPAARVVEIGRQLAAAVAAAHSGGIVHRDLKPANVQVTIDGSVKILDFGIAMVFASLSSATTRTSLGLVKERPGAQPGTPGYMSPEQLLGRSPDVRSDLFSLAVILFEMATGQRPVPSDSPLEVLVAAIRVLPRADSIASNVPAPLADLIEKGLAVDPADRFQSAAEMMAALDKVRDGLLPTGSVSGTRDRRGSWLRRLAWAIAVVAMFPVVFWTLGRLTSEAYNVTLEQRGAFAWDPPQAYLEWGRRSIVAPLVYATLALGALWLGRFLVRIVELSESARWRIEQIAVRLRGVGRRLSLDEPIVLAQCLVALGLVALGLVFWRFNALIRAWTARISTAAPAELWPLSPDNEAEKVLYRAALTVLFLLFSAGLLRVLQLRRRLGTRKGLGAFVVLAAIVACFLALNEVPYRIMWQSKAARVLYAGERCYVIGDAGPRQLLYCPEHPAPHNREVDVNDPALQRTGVIEEIFTPLAPGR